jgi:hypothetical protein
MVGRHVFESMLRSANTTLACYGSHLVALCNSIRNDAWAESLHIASDGRRCGAKAIQAPGETRIQAHLRQIPV